MNNVIASVFAASVLLAATVVPAEAQSPPTPGRTVQASVASQTTQAPFNSTNPDQSVSQSRPLFTIGRLPVTVWAPVEQFYDARMNRTAAANPIWEPGNL